MRKKSTGGSSSGAFYLNPRRMPAGGHFYCSKAFGLSYMEKWFRCLDLGGAFGFLIRTLTIVLESKRMKPGCR